MRESIIQSDAEAEYRRSMSDYSIWTILFVDVIIVGALLLASFVM